MGKGFLSKCKNYIIFAGPATLVFLTVVLVPFVYGIYLTFTSWDGASSITEFVGFDNYLSVMKDTLFWTSLLLTLKYVAFTVISINVLAFLIAYLLTSGIRGQNFFRAGFFTPNLIGGVILGFVWKFIFSDVLVYLGDILGIEALSKTMLSNPTNAFWALVIVTTWQYAGYMMVIYIAGFMNIPKELTEASAIDGANSFEKLRKIIIPLMVPSFIICVFLSLQRGFMVYDLNISLTDGGPFKSTEMVSMFVYGKAFLSQQYGVGQSEAVILFIIVAVITLLQVKFGKELEVEA